MWRPRLMVVDDDADVADIIGHVGQGLGFDTKAVSGVMAFSACTVFQPDVIVLDIFMPEIDGFEVLRYLGQAHRRTSVIIVSGKSNSFRDMAVRMGEQHGLTILANVAKPFTIARLHAVLTAAKKRHPTHFQIPLSSAERLLTSA
jgi:CheY-like chemotaxis protein